MPQRCDNVNDVVTTSLCQLGRDLHFQVSVMSLQKKPKSVNLIVRPLMQAEAGLENSDGFGNSSPTSDAFTAHLNESQSLIIGK